MLFLDYVVKVADCFCTVVFLSLLWRYSIWISGAGAVIQFSYFSVPVLQFKINHYQLYTSQVWLIPDWKTVFILQVDDTMSLLPLLLGVWFAIVVLCSLIWLKKRDSLFGLIFLTIADWTVFFMAQNPITFYLLFFESTYQLFIFSRAKIVGEDPKASRKRCIDVFYFYASIWELSLCWLQHFYIYSLSTTWWTSWCFLYNKPFSVNKHQYWMAIRFFIAFGIKAPVFPFHTWQVNLQASRQTNPV